MRDPETTRLETEVRTGRTGRRRGRRGRMSRKIRVVGGTDDSRIAERFLKDNAGGLTFLGITLGVFVSKKFLILPVAVALMLAQEKLVAAGLDRVRDAVRR